MKRAGTPPAGAPDVPANASHRLLFLIGAANLLLAMCWWALWLIDARWQPLGMPQPAIPAGWLHAVVMLYQVLASFVFGFLLTAFPRWMRLRPVDRRHQVSVAAGLLGGQLLTLAGSAVDAAGGMPLLELGALLSVAGWSLGTVVLVRLVYLDGGRNWHAVSCAFALGFGLLGLMLYTAFLYRTDARLVFSAIKIGSIAVLLPICFTVCHRMIPHCLGAALPADRPAGPTWVLAAFWALSVVHVWMELKHAYAWLWWIDLPFAILALWLLRRWWPRRRPMPPLVRMLLIGYAWLPLALALYAWQSLWYATRGAFVLGRGPAHALFIGFFSSLLVVLLARVTQGPATRPLTLAPMAAYAFVVVQALAAMRVIAELIPDAQAWHAVAAAGWALAFLPWIVRSGRIYLSPRIKRIP